MSTPRKIERISLEQAILHKVSRKGTVRRAWQQLPIEALNPRFQQYAAEGLTILPTETEEGLPIYDPNDFYESEWKADSDRFRDYLRQLEQGPFDHVVAATGTVAWDDSDLPQKTLCYARITGLPTVLAQVETYESARKDTDRGHTRLLLERTRNADENGEPVEELFVIGCHFSTWRKESDHYYVVGPLNIEEFLAGFSTTEGEEPSPDNPLMSAAGYAAVEEL